MKNSALPVIVLLASTMSMAAGSLWNMDVDAYQVQIPSVGFDDNLSGWWYAYAGDSKISSVPALQLEQPVFLFRFPSL